MTREELAAAVAQARRQDPLTWARLRQRITEVEEADDEREDEEQ